MANSMLYPINSCAGIFVLRPRTITKARESTDELLDRQSEESDGAIIVERLPGYQTQGEFQELMQSLEARCFLSFNEQNWARAAEMEFALKSMGKTMPLGDLIVARIAMGTTNAGCCMQTGILSLSPSTFLLYRL